MDVPDIMWPQPSLPSYLPIPSMDNVPPPYRCQSCGALVHASDVGTHNTFHQRLDVVMSNATVAMRETLIERINQREESATTATEEDR